MSCTASSAGRIYGLQHVCRIWEQPRSSYYWLRRNRGQGSALARQAWPQAEDIRRRVARVDQG